MMDTQQLLADYVQNGSDSAFRELVACYVNLVYSTALRLVGGDTHLAEDVVQLVFIELAKKGRSLSPEVMLGGWLYQNTFHLATKALRAERRRHIRETEAMRMNELHEEPGNDWRQVTPVLDEAITQLHADDRTAILLRFFEQRDFRAIGDALGSNEDAARMRVNRALEKLHLILKRRGVAFSAAALGTALAGEAVTAAPAGLAINVAATAFASTSTGGVIASFTHHIVMTKIQTAVIGALVVAGVAGPVAVHHQAQLKLRAREDALRQQGDQLAALTAENLRLSNQIAQTGNSQSLSQQQLDDLLKLRNEVGALRKQVAETAKIQQAQRQVQPNQPAAPVDPAEERRQEALLTLQSIAKINSARTWMTAFHQYAAENQGQFPPDFERAASYLPDDGKQTALLTTNLFEVVYQGSLNSITNPSSAIVLRENQAFQAPNGWARTYGFADGHCEIHKSDSGDFRDWESQHGLAAQNQ